jgi:DNA-binding transcriptional MocR family regulator
MVQRLLQGDSASTIAASVERALKKGRLSSSTPLPTVRAAAESLGVSPATVAAAYKLLNQRGVVVGDGRRGTRVRAFETVLALPLKASTSARAARQVAGTIDLASGNPDPELLPPLDRALRSIPATRGLYDDTAIVPALEAFVSAELDADGLPADDITLASGALDAIERVLVAHLAAGDRVAVEDPGFPGILELLAAHGFVAVPFAIDDHGPMIDSLTEAVRPRTRALILTTRGQNPTGALLSSDRASGVRFLLRQHRDLVVVENDPLGPLGGERPATVVGALPGPWALVRSVSKFLGPDLRLAVIAGDSLTIGRVQRRHAAGARFVSRILQHLVLALWADPSAGRLLAHASAVYTHRRTAFLEALAKNGIDAHGRSGLNVWVPVRNEAAIVGALAAQGWAVAAGERFRIRSGSAIRITTSALAPEASARLAADVAAALRQPAAALA